MVSTANARLIQEYLDVAENDSENAARFAGLLTDDCVWALVPPGITIAGGSSVRRFAAFAMGSRTHSAEDDVTVTIEHWFADGDRFCVEYHHAAIVTIFRLKVVERVCLVCQMRDGRFSRVNEYVDTSGSWLIWAGLHAMPLIAKLTGIHFARSLTAG